MSELKKLRKQVTTLESQNSELLILTVNNKKVKQEIEVIDRIDDVDEDTGGELNIARIKKLKEENSALRDELKHATENISELKKEIVKSVMTSPPSPQETVKSSRTEISKIPLTPRKELAKKKQEKSESDSLLSEKEREREKERDKEREKEKERIKTLEKQLEVFQISLERSVLEVSNIKEEKENLKNEIENMRIKEKILNNAREEETARRSEDNTILYGKILDVEEKEEKTKVILSQNKNYKNDIALLEGKLTVLRKVVKESEKERLNFIFTLKQLEDGKVESENKILKLSEYVFILQTQINLLNSFVGNIESITDGKKLRKYLELGCINEHGETEQILNNYYADESIFENGNQSQSESESSMMRNKDKEMEEKEKETMMEKEREREWMRQAEEIKNKNKIKSNKNEEENELEHEVVQGVNDDDEDFDLYDVYRTDNDKVRAVSTDKDKVRAVACPDDNFVTVENYENYDIKHSFEQTNALWHRAPAVSVGTEKSKLSPKKNGQEKEKEKEKEERKGMIKEPRIIPVRLFPSGRNASKKTEIASKLADDISVSNSLHSAFPPLILTPRKRGQTSEKIEKFDRVEKNEKQNTSGIAEMKPENGTRVMEKQNEKKSSSNNNKEFEDEMENKMDNKVDNKAENKIGQGVDKNDASNENKNDMKNGNGNSNGNEIDPQTGFGPGLKALLDLKVELDKQLENLNSQKLEYEEINETISSEIDNENNTTNTTTMSQEFSDHFFSLSVNEKNGNMTRKLPNNSSLLKLDFQNMKSFIDNNHNVNMIVNNMNTQTNTSPVTPRGSKIPISPLKRIKELSYDEINEIYQQQMLQQMKLQLQQQNEYELNFQQKLQTDRKTLEDEKRKLQIQIEKFEKEHNAQKIRNQNQNEEFLSLKEDLLCVQKERKLIYEDLQQLNKLKLVMQEDLHVLQNTVKTLNENRENGNSKSKIPNSPDSFSTNYFSNSNGASSASKDKQHIHQLVEALKIAKTAVEISHLDLNKTQEKMVKCMAEVDFLQNENRNLRLNAVKEQPVTSGQSVPITTKKDNIITRNINNVSHTRNHLNNNSSSSSSVTSRHKYN
jgi:hypothetical protein